MGTASLMDKQNMDKQSEHSQSKDKQNEESKRTRTIVWAAEAGLQGWTCSACDWNYPVPTLLTTAEAKTAYDRLALGKFREHACADHLTRLPSATSQSFTTRIRKLVAQGFKPKDAVELILQEVVLEYAHQPKVLEQARAEGEDFLRRVREGLI
jgi:hypothetical protein